MSNQKVPSLYMAVDNTAKPILKTDFENGPDENFKYLLNSLVKSTQKQSELEKVLLAKEMEINQIKNELDNAYEQISGSREEVIYMESKLLNSMPVPHIVYMCGSSLLFAFFCTTYYLWLFKNILIIDPYFSFTGMIGTISLFLTAFKALKHWKEHLIGNG